MIGEVFDDLGKSSLGDGEGGDKKGSGGGAEVREEARQL